MAGIDNVMAADSGRATNRRRQYVINPSLQWKYALTIAAVVFLVSSIISSIQFGVMHYQARERLIHPEMLSGSSSMTMLMFGLAFSVLTAGGVGLWFMTITHRMCGPLFVLERHLKSLIGGTIPTVCPLRKKDEFKGLFSTFMKTMDALREEKRADHEALTQALAMTRAAAVGEGMEGGESLSKLTNHLENMLAAASEAIGEEAGGATRSSGSFSPANESTPVGVV